MYFDALNFDEFKEVFKSLKRNRAAGFNDLSSNIIIDVWDSLKNILVQVLKVSIQQPIFPESLKIAKVTLILKFGDKRNISNYCSVFILPVFSNILERIMHYNCWSNGLQYEKQITQLNVRQFNLLEISQTYLKEGNTHSEFL